MSALFDDTIPTRDNRSIFILRGMLHLGTLDFIDHPLTDKSGVQATPSLVRHHILLPTVDTEQAALVFFLVVLHRALKSLKIRVVFALTARTPETFPEIATAVWHIPV